jgi:hypothetical protein
VIAFLVAVVLVLGAPAATRQSEQEGPTGYQQGVARVNGGWIFTGTTTIGRTNDALKVVQTNIQPIPLDWKRKGFNHVGDPDVAGRYLYAPLEQPQYERGDQAMARYDAKTLEVVDIVPVAQHEASFVTIDPKAMIAYSMDRFGGDALLRYDVRKHWAPLAPLTTSDPENNLFRVDLKTGDTALVGSAGHVGGEGEGIDATELKSGLLHVLTVDAARTPIWFGHYSVV